PFEGRELDILMAAPGSAAPNHLRLEEADHRLGQCVVIGVAATADGRLDAGLSKPLRVANREIVGGFNWSSQHPIRGSCDGYSEASSTPAGGRTAITWPATSCATDTASGVLGGDRCWEIERGCGSFCGGVPGGRGTLVQKRGRHATFSVYKISEITVRTVSLLHGARGDRAAARSAARRTRDRPASRETSVDHLPRTTSKRRHAQPHL